MLERKIVDALTHSEAVFSGKAVISANDEEWVYAEKGVLRLAEATPMTAERQYFWRPDQNGIDIFFDDKRFFHRLDLCPKPQAAHWCDPDQYEVVYDLTKWPEWTCAWDVRGPRKRYTMSSQYRRES